MCKNLSHEEVVGDKHTEGTQYLQYDVLTVPWGVWVQSIQDAQDGSVACDCGGQMVTATEVSREKLRDAD